jgi:2-amino-4-hydroxy-6-hydroxymethyldihydropteridine diphosphokinase
MRIQLNIGSNQGDCKALIGRAIALIAKLFSPARLLLSSYVESEPWGFESDNRFLNRGVLLIVEYSIDPLEVLHRLQIIEREVGGNAPHRNPDGSYRDRPIDIDIIDIDHISMHTAELTLPHPRMLQREFVLSPLRELDPGFFGE